MGKFKNEGNLIHIRQWLLNAGFIYKEQAYHKKYRFHVVTIDLDENIIYIDDNSKTIKLIPKYDNKLDKFIDEVDKILTPIIG